jgi:hypothetical protein
MLRALSGLELLSSKGDVLRLRLCGRTLAVRLGGGCSVLGAALEPAMEGGEAALAGVLAESGGRLAAFVREVQAALTAQVKLVE